MGHNWAGERRKERLKRAKADARRLAPRLEEARVTSYIGMLRGNDPAASDLIRRIEMGHWVRGVTQAGSRFRVNDATIEWIDENHPRWKEFQDEPINAGKLHGERRYSFRKDVRRIEALEEFLHDTQERIFQRRPHLERLALYPVYELHVKDFMVRHRRLLGINRNYTRVLQRMMEVQMLSIRDANNIPLQLPASARWRIRR